MKVVSDQLGHNWLEITADTYTGVLPAVAGIVPRSADAPVAGALAVRWQSGPKTDAGRPPGRMSALLRGGAPAGPRPRSPLIKRPDPAVPRREGLDQW